MVGRSTARHVRTTATQGVTRRARGWMMGPGLDETLTEQVLAGDPRAIARAITLVESASADGAALVKAIFGRTGRGYIVGVTGPPGAGKSTLVDRLTAHLRRAGRRVGVVAVDPTSPFTGGAILGDRVRMQAHAGDSGVFIRSMATRGHLGGLALATRETALVLDAAGSDLVLIETVGVGQDEVDVVRTADVSIVVTAPGFGDEVQALKAGIMEIGDIFVVNKADREGANKAVTQIEAMLGLSTHEPSAWRPPVLKTQATTGDGVERILDEVERFRAHTGPLHAARRRGREQFGLRQLLGHRFWQRVEEGGALRPGELDEMLDRLASRDLDPYTAAERIMERMCGDRSPLTTDH